MDKIYPLYSEKFSCIAGKCPDTCCAQWEIVIDEKFQKLYKTSSSEAAKYAVSMMYTDDEGDVCLRLQNGRCPMLNDENLCRLYIDMGKDALCDVCRIFPRFSKETENVIFSGISLSCPEAARLILEDESYGEINYSNKPKSGYTKDIFDLYMCFRERIINGGIFDICLNSEEIGDEVLFGDIKKACAIAREVYSSKYLPKVQDSLKIVRKLSGTEILTDEWETTVSRLICHLEKSLDDENYYKKRNDALIMCASFKEIKNIGIYYLYKYMPEAIYEGDINIMTKISCFSLNIICEVYAMELIETGSLTTAKKLRIAQLFSKETEHNEDNLSMLM